MGYVVSIVTLNRRSILEQVLAAVWETTRQEDAAILVTDNGSDDGTPDLLRDWERQGRLRAWLLPENIGAAAGRNAHWAECIGHDAVKLDDKVRPLCAGWLTALKALSDQHHAILGPAYDPTVRGMEIVAPCVPFIRWDSDAGVGGPYTYVPAALTEALGAWDEFVKPSGERSRYGFDDCLYIQRARLLGWTYGFSMRSPMEYLAQASPAARAHAMSFHPIYEQLLREYREAERDVLIPVESTYGWAVGREVSACPTC
jgi:glycosyltransferase involved in cell wall biosynthesis